MKSAKQTPDNGSAGYIIYADSAVLVCIFSVLGEIVPDKESVQDDIWGVRHSETEHRQLMSRRISGHRDVDHLDSWRQLTA